MFPRNGAAYDSCCRAAGESRNDGQARSSARAPLRTRSSWVAFSAFHCSTGFPMEPITSQKLGKVHGVVSGHFDRVPPCEFRSETFLRGLGTSSESFIRGDRSDVPMFRFLSEKATQPESARPSVSYPPDTSRDPFFSSQKSYKIRHQNPSHF